MITFRSGFDRPLALAREFGLPPRLEDLREEIDRVWNALTAAPPLHGWGARPEAGTFPAVDVRETDEAFTIEAELPGLEAGDVEISVAGDELSLKGSRPAAGATGGDGERPEKLTWLRRERGTGGFERRITLPVAVDAAGVAATLIHGVLTVTCPKAPQCQPHKVEVRAG